MGEKQIFQPLTREDRITVVFYRTGIVLSTVMLSGLAYLLAAAPIGPVSDIARSVEIAGYAFSAPIRLCVFFIHLYVGKFHRILKKIYYLSMFCLVVMFLLGKGSPASTLFSRTPAGALLFIPLALCLGFITGQNQDGF